MSTLWSAVEATGRIGVLAGLRPGPDQARRLLGEELRDPKYRPDLLQRVLDRLDDLLSRGTRAGDVLGGLGRPLLLVVLLVVVVGLACLLTRLRRDPRPATEPGAVFDDVRRSADEHRALARAALAAEDHDTAVVEGVRAIAAGLVERRLVLDTPAATAREVAGVAAPRFPALAEPLSGAARLFDETRYGARPADRAGAERVLDVEDALRRASPVAGAPGPVLAVPR